MNQVDHFQRFTPPALSETQFRWVLERRAERRQTALLAVAGALLQALLVLLGLLCAEAFPTLALGCFCLAIVSTAGSGVIAIVYTQKGEMSHVGHTC